MVPIDIANEAIELAAKPNWISVEEKLPETTDYVLGCNLNGVLMTTVWYYNEKWRDSHLSEYSVTHWMLLPELIQK